MLASAPDRRIAGPSSRVSIWSCKGPWLAGSATRMPEEYAAPGCLQAWRCGARVTYPDLVMPYSVSGRDGAQVCRGA